MEDIRAAVRSFVLTDIGTSDHKVECKQDDLSLAQQADLARHLQNGSRPCCNFVPNDAYDDSEAPASMYTMLSCSLLAAAVLSAAHCLRISTRLSFIICRFPHVQASINNALTMMQLYQVSGLKTHSRPQMRVLDLGQR